MITYEHDQARESLKPGKSAIGLYKNLIRILFKLQAASRQTSND